jgi:hypothetical protein
MDFLVPTLTEAPNDSDLALIREDFDSYVDLLIVACWGEMRLRRESLETVAAMIRAAGSDRAKELVEEADLARIRDEALNLGVRWLGHAFARIFEIRTEYRADLDRLERVDGAIESTCSKIEAAGEAAVEDVRKQIVEAARFAAHLIGR